jgi:hypothetical protein
MAFAHAPRPEQQHVGTPVNPVNPVNPENGPVTGLPTTSMRFESQHITLNRTQF